ncbi:hypothetical protein Hanom_Chr15g01341551 [Helianthus anomalus]
MLNASTFAGLCRLDENAISLPSGDQHGIVSIHSPSVNCRIPPSDLNSPSTASNM